MVRAPVQTNHMCDCLNSLHIDVVGTAAPMVLEFSTRHLALARKRDADAFSFTRSLEYERTPARRNQ